jgi:AcrR family transcriptional regulator
VISAALRLLQDHGLAELTMRRLAGELGVQPSALYWHVPNKQTLLAELSDRIVARSETGQSSVLELARALRFALLSCRDGAEVVSSSLALGLGGLEAQRRLATAIAATGTDETTANAAAVILVHQILGQVWHEQQRQTAELLGVPIAREPGATEDPESQVDLGVTLIMAGLARTRTEA